MDEVKKSASPQKNQREENTEKIKLPDWYKKGTEMNFDSNRKQTDLEICSFESETQKYKLREDEAGTKGNFELKHREDKADTQDNMVRTNLLSEKNYGESEDKEAGIDTKDNAPDPAIPSYDVNRDNLGFRGLAIVMTNDFEDTSGRGGKFSPLTSVCFDGIMLWKMFRTLGFRVKWFANSKADDMEFHLKASVRDNDVGKMVVCCISSHGADSQVFGQDGDPLYIKKMVDTLDCVAYENNKLCSQPKLFFIDACQGAHLKRATTVSLSEGKKFDVTQDFSQIAERADILLGYAAYQDTSSIITSKGSHYINQLVKLMMKYHSTEDIHLILVAVCKAVSCIKLRGEENKSRAQLPMVLSTLTKKLIMQ